jgi:hypothetical protein
MPVSVGSGSSGLPSGYNISIIIITMKRAELETKIIIPVLDVVLIH